MEKTQIEQEIRGMIVKRLSKIDPALITLDVELETLGMDSLAASSILADMEEKYAIVVPGKESCILKNLGLAVDYIAKQKA